LAVPEKTPAKKLATAPAAAATAPSQLIAQAIPDRDLPAPAVPPSALRITPADTLAEATEKIAAPPAIPRQATSQQVAAQRTVAHQAIAPEPAVSEVIPSHFAVPVFASIASRPARSPYEAWTLILGTLAILAIVGVSFIIGSRIGWLRATEAPLQALPQAQASSSQPAESEIETKSIEIGSLPAKSSRAKSTRTEPKAAPAADPSAASTSGDLVVYEKGKVVFRIKNQPEAASQQPRPVSTQPAVDSAAEIAAANRVSAPLSTPKTSGANSPRSIWLNPSEAEVRLVNRIEPEYPTAARAARRAGNVVLEVDVAEDGSVSSIRTLKGDPVLAAAATQAVRNWRYQPYRLHDRPSQFHTDVTLSFAISN
jgi:TonB family protein